MRSGPGPRALNAVIGAPRANVGVLRAAFRGPRWSQTGHATTGPAGVAGHCESANLSQRVAINLLHSQCERFSGTVRVGESVPVAHSESVREGLGMRSHFYLVANRRRGSVNRSPQGAIRGGFAVSPQKSERFARGACLSGALARARRERRASSMSAAWDSSPALSPVPWGERNGEAFNCVPGG